MATKKMKKGDKVLVVATGGIFFILVIVALVLWLKRRDEDKELLHTDPKSNASTYSYSSPSIDKDVAVKDASQQTVLYIQNQVNKTLDSLNTLGYQNLPERLEVDGVFGQKTTDALNYLFEELAQTANASSKTLKELQTILKNKGVNLQILA
ncbi:MAG: hypothetical protein GY810_31695 [Aureispira sp.]|nr:hypothetical protein [Aureispira sp.]